MFEPKPLLLCDGTLQRDGANNIGSPRLPGRGWSWRSYWSSVRGGSSLFTPTARSEALSWAGHHQNTGPIALSPWGNPCWEQGTRGMAKLPPTSFECWASEEAGALVGEKLLLPLSSSSGEGPELLPSRETGLGGRAPNRSLRKWQQWTVQMLGMWLRVRALA